MSEKGILFSDDMVRAIITCAKCGKLSVPFSCQWCGSTEFVKSQTRRCHIRPQPDLSQLKDPLIPLEFRKCPVLGPTHTPSEWGLYAKSDSVSACPIYGYTLPYKVGDLLCVKETWRPHEEWEGSQCPYLYRADYPEGLNVHWEPSIQMPEKAARLWLKVTNIRFEQLQEISCDDAIAEGVEAHDDDGVTYYGPLDKGHICPRVAFQWLWDSLYGRRPGLAWADNPWVSVYEIERVAR